MVRTELVMPQLGLTMAAGTISAWRAQVGDAVRQGETIVEVETDKATVEVEAPADGFLRQILVPAGATAPVGTVLAIITTTPAEPLAAAAEPPTEPAGASGAEGAPRLSPAARRRARELGVDLSRVAGSGPGGRVTLADVEAAAGGDERVPLTPMRRAIARAMVLSHRTVPAFSISRQVDMFRVQEVHRVLRSRFKSPGPADVSLTDFLLQAVARVLPHHPDLNATFVGDPDDPGAHIRRHGEVHLGLAVATAAGLATVLAGGEGWRLV